VAGLTRVRRLDLREVVVDDVIRGRADEVHLLWAAGHRQLERAKAHKRRRHAAHDGAGLKPGARGRETGLWTDGAACGFGRRVPNRQRCGPAPHKGPAPHWASSLQPRLSAAAGEPPNARPTHLTSPL
jgi:hypothetical protein